MCWVSKDREEFEVRWGSAGGREEGAVAAEIFSTVACPEDCNEEGDADSGGGAGIDSLPGCTDLGTVKSGADEAWEGGDMVTGCVISSTLLDAA